MPPFEHNQGRAEAALEVSSAGGSLSLLAVSERRSPAQEARELLAPGASAVCTRAAVLGLTGRLHTDFRSIERTLTSIDSPLGSQFKTRLADMRGAGWRFECTSEAKLGGAGGMYVPGSREVLYTKPSIIPYMLGLTGEHPSASAVSIVAHELGHHDGIVTHPENAVSGRAQQRTLAFRTLATETNAIVAQIQVEHALKSDVYCGPRRSALLTNTLGGQIYHDWYKSVPALGSVTEAEANTFVKDYIRNRWGPEILDSRTGLLKPLSLDPGGVPFVGEPLPADAEAIAGRDAYLRNRVEVGSESRMLKFSRFCQSTVGSSAIHGVKILGAVGAFSMANSIHSGFNESVGTGCGETARAGIGLGGFEVGTLAGRTMLSNRFAPPVGKILLAGFVGAYVADRALGSRVFERVQRLMD